MTYRVQSTQSASSEASLGVISSIRELRTKPQTSAQGVRLNAAVSLVDELAGPQAEHDSSQGDAAAAPPPPGNASKQAKSEYLLRSCSPLLVDTSSTLCPET